MVDCVPSLDRYKRMFPELEENVKCVEEYLNLYDFFTQDPNNERLVDELYDRTLDMIDDAIETRFLQGQIATRQLTHIMHDLIEKYPYGFAIVGSGKNRGILINSDAAEKMTEKEKLAVEIADDLMSGLNDAIRGSIDFLRAKKEFCLDPDTPKFLCIESFANSAHVKGPYIPLGCGLPYPEFREVLSSNEDLPENVLGGYMSDVTVDALNCIFERRR